MSNWIRRNAIAFERGGVRLAIDRRDAVDLNLKIPETNDERIAPQALEDELRSLIELHRPELKGCMFWTMEFDIRCMCWMIIVEHGSLPKVPAFSELPVMPLIPEGADYGVRYHRGPLVASDDALKAAKTQFFKGKGD